jgi:hypothetical protein
MAVDFGALVRGRLIYEEEWAALDDVRFDRVASGFSQHYLVTRETPSRFTFSRGEGYLKLERWDAFGYVDGGMVERLRDGPERPEPLRENVLPFQPLYARLRFDFRIHAVLIWWLGGLLFGAMAVGGDWLFWGAGFVCVYLGTVLLIRRSLKKKLKLWLARTSWN